MRDCTQQKRLPVNQDFDIGQIITGNSSPLNNYQEDLFGFLICCRDKVEQRGLIF